TDEIFRVERNVVLAELARDADLPESAMFDDMLGQIFHTHPYRWSPGGNPDHLNAADVSELQQFFDTFYTPRNAALIIIGDFDPAAARQLVHTYFDWIAPGPEISRNIPSEPPQTA